MNESAHDDPVPAERGSDVGGILRCRVTRSQVHVVRPDGHWFDLEITPDRSATSILDELREAYGADRIQVEVSSEWRRVPIERPG